MFQLAYISSARAPLDAAQLADILAVSRRNNERSGITGLLVPGGRRFLQVLEGPEQEVLKTYVRIQADPRHRAFVLVCAQKVEERAFGHWSMACRDEAGSDGQGLEKLVESLVAKISDRNLRAQFTGFAKLHDRAA
jgi:hypothetical protein